MEWPPPLNCPRIVLVSQAMRCRTNWSVIGSVWQSKRLMNCAGKLTPRDLAALTPLIWDHVNPYGRFDLDMNDRLPLK